MGYDSLREAVCRANLEVVRAGLVELTWGNVSGTDRAAGVVAIKPSGVGYAALRPEDMVVLDLETGEVVEGVLRPSSDTPTHLHLYRSFAAIGGVVHTHSRHAVSFAQAEREIPCMGTTHADHFYGAVPVTGRLTAEEIREGYEHNTGEAIVRRFRDAGLDPLHIPGVLVAGHGPFAWGETVQKAVDNAVVLESVACMALQTYALNASAGAISQELLDKHFLRKHGASAYYGQEHR